MSEQKGRIYKVLTTEGEKKIIDDMTEREIKRLKAKFLMTFIDAQDTLDQKKTELDADLLTFQDGFDVDERVEAELEVDQLNLEIAKIKEIYFDLFGEELK
jgi:hypothetical protein